MAVLAFQWDEHGLPHVLEAVTELHRRGIKKLVIIGRKSQGRGGPDVLLEYGLRPGLQAYSAGKKNSIAWAANASLRAMQSNFVFLDLMKIICPTQHHCEVLTHDGQVIFFDGSHLSPAGARYFGQALQATGWLPF